MKMTNVLSSLVFILFTVPAFAEEGYVDPYQGYGQPTQDGQQYAPDDVSQYETVNQADPYGAEAQGEQTMDFQETVEKVDPNVIDLENEDTFMDIREALQSHSFVHRAVLSAVIQKTSGISFNKFYLNHLMGFSAVLQRGTPGSTAVVWTKYSKAATGFSAGYVFDHGHSFEAGIEFSGVSSLFAGYRYFWDIPNLSFWPMFGIGGGVDLGSLRLSDVPDAALMYQGKKSMGFVSLGVLVPLVDIGIKIEVRAQFYGTDRLVLSQGVGAILFL